MNDETENTRRASDKHQAVIEKLILEENDPKQRGLMLLLQNVNLSLIANTIATQAIQVEVENHRKDFLIHLDNFEKHSIKEEAIMNKGEGAWRVLATVLILAQGIAVYGWNASRNEIEAMKATAEAMKATAVEAQITHEKLVSRLNHLEVNNTEAKR